MRKIRFCTKDETQRGVLLNDGRVISIFGEDNKMCMRFNEVIDIEKGVIYDRCELTEQDKMNGLTTLNDIIGEGLGKEVTCYDCIDFDLNIYPCDVSKGDEEKIINKAYRFFKKNGVVVTKEAIRHNFDCWKYDYKSGYRDDANGYHLFSPCGCNPLSMRRTILHPLCDDWQTTYYC